MNCGAVGKIKIKLFPRVLCKATQNVVQLVNGVIKDLKALAGKVLLLSQDVLIGLLFVPSAFNACLLLCLSRF